MSNHNPEHGDEMDELGFDYPPKNLSDQALPQHLLGGDVPMGRKETAVLASFLEESAHIQGRMQTLSHRVKQQLAAVILEQDQWDKMELQQLVVLSNAIDGLLEDWIGKMAHASSVLAKTFRNLHSPDTRTSLGTRMSYVRTTTELRQRLSQQRFETLKALRRILEAGNLPLKVKGDFSLDLEATSAPVLKK